MAHIAIVWRDFEVTGLRAPYIPAIYPICTLKGHTSNLRYTLKGALNPLERLGAHVQGSHLKPCS